MSSSRFYGVYTNFNPKLIILQIICMQLLYYTALGFFLMIFDFSFAVPLHLGQFFHYSTFNTDHIYGNIAIISNFLNIPINIIGLIFIVVKANKVLDFILTQFIIHFFFCLVYNKYHTFNMGWILINGICGISSILIGEYICLKFEQKEIKFFENIIGLVSNSSEKKAT